MDLTTMIRNHSIAELEKTIQANPPIVNQPDERGFTPLVLSTYLGNQAAAELLIKYGADLDAQDAMMGNTALMGVCFKGSLALARLLLEKGANPHIRNNNGETALDFAQNGNHQEIVQLLSNA